MYFHGDKGRQVLDLRNDLVITFDTQLVTAKSKKVAPDRVSNATYIIMGKTSRLKATIKVLAFIWSKHLLTFKVKTMAGGKTKAAAVGKEI